MSYRPNGRGTNGARPYRGDFSRERMAAARYDLDRAIARAAAKRTWTTRDGRVIPIAEMATEHLRNTVAMLRRNGYVTPSEMADLMAGAAMLNGEYAHMAAEEELGRTHPYPKLEALEQELARRGD